MFNLLILLLVFEEAICCGIQKRYLVLAAVLGKEDILFRFILLGYFFIFWDRDLCWLVSVDLTQTRVTWEGCPSIENCLYQIGQEASLCWGTFLIYDWCGRAQPTMGGAAPEHQGRVLGYMQTVERELLYSASPWPLFWFHLPVPTWLPLMMGGHVCDVVNSFLCKLLLVIVLSQ